MASCSQAGLANSPRAPVRMYHGTTPMMPNGHFGVNTGTCGVKKGQISREYETYIVNDSYPGYETYHI